MNMTTQHHKKSFFTLEYAEVIIIVALLVLVFVPVQKTFAGEIIVVNTTTDAPDLVNDGVCEATAGAGDCTLRAAFDEVGSYDTIMVPAGTYTLDTATYGDIEHDDFLILVGEGAGTTIIQADTTPGTASTGVFNFDMYDYAITLIGVTIRHGNNTSDGGGIYAYGYGELSLIDCVVTENVGSYGGGIYAESSDSEYLLSVELFNTTVSNNSASSDGGGIYFEAYSDNSALRLENSTVNDNTSSSYGGGISFYAGDDYGGRVDIINSTIKNNTGDYGGGLYVEEYWGYADIYLQDSLFSGNTATTDGGGVYIYYNEYGNLTVLRTTFDGNTAGGYGGGLYDDYSYDTYIADSTFINNHSVSDGGGLYIYSGYSGTILDTTISDNTSDGSGGGVYMSSGPSWFEGNTVTGNTADFDNDGSGDGGGIYNDSYKAYMKDNVIQNNTSTGGLGPDCYQSSANAGFVSMGGNVLCDPTDSEWDAHPSDTIGSCSSGSSGSLSSSGSSSSSGGG